MPIITKDAAVRLHEVVRRRHEDPCAPTCAPQPRQRRRRSRRQSPRHRRDVGCSSGADAGRRSAATRARRAWASRLIGVAWKSNFGTFIFCLYALRTCRSGRRRLTRDVRDRFGLTPQLCPRCCLNLFAFLTCIIYARRCRLSPVPPSQLRGRLGDGTRIVASVRVQRHTNRFIGLAAQLSTGSTVVTSKASQRSAQSLTTVGTHAARQGQQ